MDFTFSEREETFRKAVEDLINKEQRDRVLRLQAALAPWTMRGR